jgi:flagella basal body P-ring formation protein FlgA
MLRLWLLCLICGSVLSAVIISPDRINQDIVATLYATHPRLQDLLVSAQVTIRLNQEQKFNISTDNYRLAYRLEGALAPRMYAHITVAEGPELRTMRVPFLLTVYAPILHARADYARDTLVTANMFYLKTENIVERLDSVLFSEYRFEGQRLRARLGADQIVSRWMLMRDPVVQVGEIVSVVFRAEEVELRLQAEVLQPGFVGDKIRVRLRPTKKIVSATILAPGIYEVVF